MIPIFIFFLGVIIGSFLNVVIVRLPRGGSLNEPKRSFCPKCHRTLPWWENIPVISWLLLRGRCAGCHERISIQYPLVELSTGFLFLFCSHSFSLPMGAVAALFVSLLLVATVIDLQHWIIPNEITLGGIAAGVAASALLPELMETTSRGTAVLFSAGTAAAGYGLLWGILESGKLIFGKKRTLFAEPLLLRLCCQEKPVLHLGEEDIALEELLLRPSDRIVAHANWIEVADQRFTNQQFFLQHQGLRINEHAWPLEKIVPLQAEITEVTLPREAMGFGDVKFLGCIGAFLGWKGMLFALFGGSILGSVVALFLLLITRGRVGRSIPFGPALAAAAALWLFRYALGFDV
jgi:leader peptidase (prepilin peptidase)/N-methyltransferase